MMMMMTPGSMWSVMKMGTQLPRPQKEHCARKGKSLRKRAPKEDNTCWLVCAFVFLITLNPPLEGCSSTAIFFCAHVLRQRKEVDPLSSIPSLILLYEN